LKVESKWILVCIVGGILMFLGNFSGLQLFQLIIGLYFEYGVPYVRSVIGPIPTTALTIILTIILYIMLGGGISVIIGAILVLLHLHKFGKLIITLGTGTGLIGISIFLLIETTIINPIETWLGFGFFILRLLIDLYFLGIILAIIARKKMKKFGEEEEFTSEFTKDLLSEKEEEIDQMQKKVICPICKSANSDTESNCRYCGTALKYDLESHL
jgi:hypothetical protein